MMNWENGHMDTGGTIVMVMGMVGFWVLVALAIVWFVRSSRAAQVSTSAASGERARRTAPEELLAERLARGDIEPEEYRARMTALTASE